MESKLVNINPEALAYKIIAQIQKLIEEKLKSDIDAILIFLLTISDYINSVIDRIEDSI